MLHDQKEVNLRCIVIRTLSFFSAYEPNPVCSLRLGSSRLVRSVQLRAWGSIKPAQTFRPVEWDSRVGPDSCIQRGSEDENTPLGFRQLCGLYASKYFYHSAPHIILKKRTFERKGIPAYPRVLVKRPSPSTSNLHASLTNVCSSRLFLSRAKTPTAIVWTCQPPQTASFHEPQSNTKGRWW